MENYQQRIEKLERELLQLKNDCIQNKRKFKIGDWVCFNHGEYPEYFSKEVGQITHFDYKYDSKGIAQFKWVHGGGWDDEYLRFAHQEEIEYAKSELPFFYNVREKKYERVQITGENFKIGNLIDTSDFKNLNGKKIISFLMETDFMNSKGKEILSKIFEKLK